jgi:Animal haem peroxidase
LSTSAVKPRRPWIGARVFGSAMMAIDRRLGWERLPSPLGLLVIFGVRTVLRRRNLYDAEQLPTVNTPPVGPLDPSYLDTRTVDGTYNDLNQPSMGMAGSRFGRNVPIDRRFESDATLLEPNPREVSRALMTKETFQPATGANALVAAWLQFMIRGGFSHGTSPKDNPFQVELADDDHWPQRPMLIMRTPPDPTRPTGRDDLPPTYVNVHAHWWDAKQVYGMTKQEQAYLRTGEDGKLRIDDSGLLPFPTDPDHNPTLVPGFWLGLAMMQVLFAREHNAICDKLRSVYPSWSDERLYTRARLINAALINKIHTVDWSPTVINHPTTRAALHADWWGVAGKRIHNRFGRISRSRLISGALGAVTQHYGVPFAITEEFVAIYRMHQLIPDDYDFRSVADDLGLRQASLQEISGPPAVAVLKDLSMTDLIYSFGTMNAGLVTLHNYPRHLQSFERPDGHIMDLAATDILRCRELDVPRYNEFRRLLHLAPAKDFESLTDNPVWAQEMRRIYKDDIERVDLLVGMYAEPRPPGFAFSNTAFHLFVLTAPRRLSSDRFLSTDFSPKVYTPTGIEWVERNNMGTILLRHHPELLPAMRSSKHAFRPWVRSQRRDRA